jgi:hypothetical protein
MEQANLVHPSAFCWNPHCTDYGKVDHGNIRRFGRTQAGTQRYQCRTCSGTFVETIGTVFYGRHHAGPCQSHRPFGIMPSSRQTLNEDTKWTSRSIAR